MAKVLELTFLTAANKPVKLTVDEPHEDLTEGQVETVMQRVIASNIFLIEESPTCVRSKVHESLHVIHKTSSVDKLQPVFSPVLEAGFFIQ